jgi:hypothetical protein
VGKGGSVKIRNVASALIAAISLAAVPALSAFQVEDITKTTAKKAKKSAKTAAETAPNAESTSATTAKNTTAAPAKTVSDSEISAAKASGQVWVNTDTGVYHKGGRWYGATKQGKFMSEQDAIKAGYHAAKTK